MDIEEKVRDPSMSALQRRIKVLTYEHIYIYI